MKDYLVKLCQGMGLELSPRAAEAFMVYKDLLLDWNTRMNLTAITEEKEVMEKHFADSLSAAIGFDLAGKRAIDVGTGAGFPGLPIKLAFPEVDMTLLDALQKRLDFLAEVQTTLGITGLTLIHARAEDGGQDPALREAFDVCFSRAVAALPVLAEYCLPFVKVGGYLVALKGPDGEREAAAAQNALKILGGTVREMKAVTIPGTDLAHTLVVVEKIAPTPKKYPRNAGKIKKSPL